MHGSFTFLPRLLGLSVLTVLLGAALVSAAVPDDPAERAKVIGQPTALTVQPEAITLNGSRAVQQVVVTAKYADGTIRDLTPFCDLSLETPGFATVAPGGFLMPAKSGATALIVKAGPATAKVPVTVSSFEAVTPVSFRHEVVAAMNVGGCNAGACHGTPSGKNGFKLSLRGYDPAADYTQLTRDVLGRRSDRMDPEASLILLKSLGRIPHEGGQRYPVTSIPARAMRDWLAEGLRDDAATLPTLQSINVLPGARVLKAPAKWQQLTVLATYSDNSVRDVTRLTVFTSSDTSVADVNSTGLVEFRSSGESAILCRYLDQLQAVRLTYLEPREGFAWSNPPEVNYVDKNVFAKLKMMSIAPSDVCTDEEFIRRAYLDLCAILPKPDEVKAFLANTDAAKRAKLIDQLLEKPEYADFWTLKWSDVLRSSRKTLQIKGVHSFQSWLRGQIDNNTGLDAMVRELLTANGSTSVNPAANFYRVATDPTVLAESTAQLFFGVRMQCAKCHNHPFERWSQDDYYSMAAFFARVKQKKDAVEPGPNPQTPGALVIYSERAGEVNQARTQKVMAPKVFGMAAPTIPAGKDRREALADLVTSPENPFFSKSVVNRIWFHLNGKGIVDPVDDFRDSNPSANDELLDALAKDFVAHKFDAKYIIRTIMNSRTYQLSAQPNTFNKDDAKYFSHAVTKMLSAEQLLDSICAVTEVPEKFAGLPLGTRATQLPDGEVNHPFLKTFGQPARELACECERESDSNLAQALLLINGPTVNEKLRNANNRVGRMLAKNAAPEEIITELYMATLSRTPNPTEMQVSLAHVTKSMDKRKAWEDVQWALLNAKEFLFRH